MSYLENTLNQFDSYNYNIELHMVHPKDHELFYSAIPGRTIVIADNSRESRYNISDLEQTFKVGYGEVRNAYGSMFNLKISEPNGVTLLEKIVESAASLGIDNHLQAKYFLILEFIGRTSTGAAKRHPTKFIYSITFRSLQTQIDAGGATYNIDAVDTSYSGFNYLEQVVRSQITLEAATVGEFISEFMSKFKRSLENEVLYNLNQIFADEYEIEFDSESGTEEWLSWPIQQAGDDLRVSGQSKIGDKIHFTIPNGSNLSDIISMALQSTAEYKQIVTSNNGFMKPAPHESASLNFDEFPVFFKVVPKIQYGIFDNIRGDFQRKITFKVKKHIIADRILDSEQYHRSITDTTIQNSRINNMISEGLLRKRYDYIFTGMNTEILNLDLRFDNQYYEISVIGNGQLGNPDNVAATSGQSAPTVHDAINTLIREQSQAQREITRLRALQSGEGVDDNTEVPEDIAEQLERLEEEQLERGQQLVELNAQLNTQRDVPRSDISMQVRFAGDVVDDSDIYGPENDLNGGTLQFGAVKANLENSADLMKIEMQVRGDPYWLGQPNSFYRDAIGTEATIADFERGGLFFFLNVKFPVTENASGRRLPRDDYSLSGTYRVLSVINRFSGGQFIQYLEAVRDMSTNTKTVISTLQNTTTTPAEADATTPTTPSQATQTDPATLQEQGNDE